MPTKITIKMKSNKIPVQIKARAPRIVPRIVKKDSITWNTILKRSRGKRLMPKELSALWKTRPTTWKEVDRFIAGKTKFLARFPTDGEAFDIVYTENNEILAPEDYKTITEPEGIELQTREEFYALRGRYRVSYNGAEFEVVLKGGRSNNKDFFDDYDDWATVDLGERIRRAQYSGMFFKLIPDRVPDKDKAKRDSQRYNIEGFHCVWTPIRNYYVGLREKCKMSTKAGRKRYTRMQDFVEYFEQLSKGQAATSADIQKVCDDKNIKVIIEYVGFDKDNVEIFQRGQQLCTSTDVHKFTCVHSTHLEYYYAKSYGMVLLDEKSFRDRLSVEPMIHPVKLLRPKKGQILSHEQRIYCFDSYKDNKRYVIDGYETFLDEDSSVMKYLKWAQKNYSMPDEIPVSKLIRCSMKNPSHCSIPEFESMPKENLWYTDAIKAYANFRLHPDYRGFPAKLHDWCFEPSSSIYLEYLGYWYIECDEKIKYHEDSLTGAWTTIALRYFHSLGIPFQVKFGAWSMDSNDIEDFAEDILEKKVYTVLIGLLQQKGCAQTQRLWIDPENVLDEGKGIKRTTTEKKGKNCNMLAAYYLDYAWTRIHEMATKHDAVAIKTDGIVTRHKVPPTIGWHECQPYVHDDTTYTPYFLNNIMINENINPFPSAMPYQYEHDLRGKLRSNIYLSGAGGTGKTTTCMHQFSYIGITYSSLAKEQVARFQDKFHCATNIHKLPQQNWITGVVLIDEVSQLTLGSEEEKASVQWLELYARAHGVRLIYAGDKAQISLNGLHSAEGQSMWEYLEKLPSYEFRENHRAKDLVLKNLLRELRDLVLSPIPQPLKIRKILAFCTKFQKKPKDFKGLCIGNRTQKEGEEGKYQSIDKMQGETLEQEFCVRIDGNTYRRDVFHNLVYTGLSRATLYENVYVQDITNKK